MKIFFSHGDGVEFPALLLQPLCAADLERRDPQETRGREGKKNGTKGYMLLWIVARDLSLSLSLFPPSPFFIIPATYTYSPVSWTSRFRSNDCTPRQWRAGGLKFRFRPRRRFLFFLSFPRPPCIPLHHWQGKVSLVSRETFSLSRPLPCFTRQLGHGLPGYRSNYLKPRHPTGRNIFFPPPSSPRNRPGPLSAPASDVFPGRRRDERALFLHGVNLPRN